MLINIFIQARMSSARFPGKVLAPFNNKPLIKNILDRLDRIALNNIQNLAKIVVLTSTEPTDDPLAAYLASINVECFRGELDNVAARFKAALTKYPCDYFVRICADSPYIEPSIINQGISNISSDIDLVTNVFPRSFAKGHSVEIVNAGKFAKLSLADFTADESEHVTKYFYNRATEFNIKNFTNTDHSNDELCVDTIDDLKALEGR